jgi:inner membrane protein involved in colicin E2 resistance
MTMFQLIHDRRGATAFETILILIPLFMIIFAIFDLSRYALTWYSVSNLADEASRRQTICYSPLIAGAVKTVACPSDPLSTDQKKIVAPALFWDHMVPTVTTVPTDTTVSQPRVITASVTGFKPVISLIPIPYLSTLTVTVNLPF